MRATRQVMALAALLLLWPLFMGGCSAKTRACKAGTLFLTVDLDSSSAAAITLDVRVALGTTVKEGTVAHVAGVASGTVEVDFAGGYPTGQSASVTVLAESANGTLGSGTTTVTFSGGCQSTVIHVSAATPDLGTPDLSVADAADDGGGALDSLPPPVDFSDSSCSASNCSGTCVDGVCCDTACTGQCEACNLPGKVGTCSPVTGAPKNGRTLCTTSTAACAGSCDGNNRTACTYPTTTCSNASCSGTVLTLASQCQNGACVAPAPATKQCTGTCSNGSCNDCTMDSQCGSGQFCDSGGTCSTQLTTGAAATCSDSHCKQPGCHECASGNCADGACCTTPCTGLCNDCTSNRGTCAVRTGAPLASHGSCSNATCSTCNGSDASACHDPAPEPTCTPATCNTSGFTPASVCSGGSCSSQSATSCGVYACTLSGCKTTCANDNDCADTVGHYCAGGNCVPKLANGQSCTAADNCSSGNCVANSNGTGSTCCGTACSGGVSSCQVCDGTGGSAAGVCGAAHVNTSCGVGSGSCSSALTYCDGTHTYCPVNITCNGTCCTQTEYKPGTGTCCLHVAPNPATCPTDTGCAN